MSASTFPTMRSPSNSGMGMNAAWDPTDTLMVSPSAAVNSSAPGSQSKEYWMASGTNVLTHLIQFHLVSTTHQKAPAASAWTSNPGTPMSPSSNVSESTVILSSALLWYTKKGWSPTTFQPFNVRELRWFEDSQQPVWHRWDWVRRFCIQWQWYNWCCRVLQMTRVIIFACEHG